ncbi:MAG: acyltransferase [Formivibrio sp.]|nr:acyltransferase [Formivibrio sp.]
MIKNIQLLRAIAAISVMICHFESFTKYLFGFQLNGRGVDLFFVISGCVMALTTRDRHPSGLNFFKNRIARVVPTYWLLTLAVFSVALVAPKLLGATRPNFIELIDSLLFIPFIKSSGLYQPVLFLGWTLNLEMFFYAIFAIFLSMKNYTHSLIGIAVTLMAIVAAAPLMPAHSVWHDFYGNPMMIEFAMGLAVPYLADFILPKLRSRRMPLVIASVLALPTIFLCDLLAPEVPNLVIALIAGTAAAVLVVSAIALERIGFIYAGAIGVSLGNASYSLYLIHPFVTQPIQRIVLAKTHSPALISISLVAGSALILLCAVLMFRLIERPISKAAKAALRG